MIRFHVDTSGFARWRQQVEANLRVGSPGPMQDAMLRASNEYHSSMRRRFRSASEGDGTWEPLARSTEKQHQKKGDGPPAHSLRLTGDLELSLQRGQENHVVEVNQDGVTEGTEDPKARFHQDGTDRIPARPILVDPDQQTLDRMHAQIADGISRSVHGVNTPFHASQDELQAIFGIDLI